MTKHVITLGADPEFFVTIGDKYVPACGLFGGEKGNPVQLSDEGGYLEDGCAIEINVKPSDNIYKLAERVRRINAAWTKKFVKYHLNIIGAARFTKDQLITQQANEIGCSGDLHAWGVRATPLIQMFGTNRFAGGHIHIGIDPWPEHLSRGDIIRFLDLSVLLPNMREQNKGRQAFYGGPGIYRDTSYGVEWRSPDAAWVSGTNGIIRDFDRAHRTLAAILANERPVPLNEIIGEVVNKYELLDELQAQPYKSGGAQYPGIANSIAARIEKYLEDTPEAREIKKKQKDAAPPPKYIRDPLGRVTYNPEFALWERTAAARLRDFLHAEDPE